MKLEEPTVLAFNCGTFYVGLETWIRDHVAKIPIGDMGLTEGQPRYVDLG